MIQILGALIRVARSRCPVRVLALDSTGDLGAAGQREILHDAGGRQVADAFVYFGPVLVSKDGVDAFCCVFGDVEAGDAGCAG